MNFDYPKNVHFKCSRCALCCGDAKNRVRTILLLEKEAELISKNTSISVKSLAEKVIGHEPYAYRMKKTRDGKCMFLKDNLCSIYQIRPLICRFYPFELKNVGKDRYSFICTDECPSVGEGPELKKEFFKSLFKEMVRLIDKNSNIT